MERIINAGIDWITITYPYQETSFDVKDEYGIYSLSYLVPTFEYILKLNPNECERKVLSSRVGYKNLCIYRDSTYIKFGGNNTQKEIPVAFDENKETIFKKYDSMCVDIGGTGIRRCEELDVDMLDFLDTRNRFNGKGSRVDIFIDLINYDVNIDEIYNKLIKNEFVSSFKKFKFISENEIHTNGLFVTGKSLEFGSRESSIELVIYDKKLEREHNDYSVEVENWIRFEIRYRYDKADPALCEYLNMIKNGEDEIDYAVSLLNGILELKEPGSDSNKSRWQTWSKWQEWFGIEKNKIKKQTQQHLESQFTKKRRWFAESAFRNFTLNKLYDLYSMDKTFFDDVFLKGLEKFKKSDLDKLNNQFKRDGVPITLTSEDIKRFAKELKVQLELGVKAEFAKKAKIKTKEEIAEDLEKINESLDLPF